MTRLKKKVEESPPWVQNSLTFVELPEKIIILRRLFLFMFMVFWSVMNSAKGGPAFQLHQYENFLELLHWTRRLVSFSYTQYEVNRMMENEDVQD